MVLAHIIRWVCGRIVFRWEWITPVKFAALPHLTQKMIAIKVAKMAAAGITLGCVSIGAWELPRQFGDAGNLAPGGRNSIHQRAPIPTPEPGCALIFGAATVYLIRSRSKRQKETINHARHQSRRADADNQ